MSKKRKWIKFSEEGEESGDVGGDGALKPGVKVLACGWIVWDLPGKAGWWIYGKSID